MARFDERSGQLYVTELGRVASHFYIRHKSIVAFNELLKPHMTESEVHAAHCHLCPLRLLPSLSHDNKRPVRVATCSCNWQSVR